MMFEVLQAPEDGLLGTESPLDITDAWLHAIIFQIAFSKHYPLLKIAGFACMGR
jgi:hypothetical protein